jgi:hypothetical protein
MTHLTRKVWTGIGAATLAGTMVGTMLDPAAGQHAGHATGQPTAGGKTASPSDTTDKVGRIAAPQGGEAYLTDGGPKDTRIRIYRDIGLMRGHLLVGAELVELGLWDEALPHFLHPTEELYGLMERYIKLHKVTPFDAQLKALSQAVKAKNQAAYRQAAKVVEARLENALTSFRRFMTVQPFSSYTARTLAELAKVAQSEYEASIENGRFTKPVEYQDSRGFIWHAEQLVARYEAEFAKIDAAALARLKTAIVDAKAAWPTPVPPAAPVVTVEAQAARLDALVKATERFH